MGILSSLHVGVSGLQAAGEGMSVIGDNIANAGTTGFKASRPEFQDVLARSLKGIDGGDQIGAGTKMAHIKPAYTQGVVQRTENVTDLALNGDGWFEVEAPFGKGYTRDGSFHFDKDGNLINGDGYKVKGYQANEEGKVVNSMGPIKLESTTVPARKTNKVTLSMNLDVREPIMQFDITKAEKTSNFNSGVTVYDNVGTARLVTLYFNKTADNQWTYHACIAGDQAQGDLPSTQLVEMATGNLIFNDKGQLQSEVEGANAFNFNKGAQPGQKIEFDFGKSITEGGKGVEATTQYGSRSTVASHIQDGFSAGTLASMSFNDDGVLSAVFSNGETRDVAQIAIARFTNNEGLFKLGKNLMKETRKSGPAAVGKPGLDGRGEVISRSLELSGVDIASEFVNLMTSQRNFQANSKTISTADGLLNEVLQLKR